MLELVRYSSRGSLDLVSAVVLPFSLDPLAFKKPSSLSVRKTSGFIGLTARGRNMLSSPFIVNSAEGVMFIGLSFDC